MIEAKFEIGDRVAVMGTGLSDEIVVIPDTIIMRKTFIEKGTIKRSGDGGYMKAIIDSWTYLVNKDHRYMPERSLRKIDDDEYEKDINEIAEMYIGNGERTNHEYSRS